MGDYQETLRFAEKMLDYNRIPHSILEPPYQGFVNLDIGIRATIYGINELPKQVEEYLNHLQENTLYLTTDLYQCNYGAMKLPNSNKIFVCGPVIYEKISSETFQKLFEKLDMEESYRNTLYHFYTKVTFLDSTGIVETIMLALGQTLYGDEFRTVYEDMSAFEHYKRIYQNALRIPDKPFSNMELIEQRYEMENALLHEIASGNEKNAFEWLDKMEKASAVGLRRMKDEFRNIKDYLLTLNTLARKAVETAGVHPIFIDAISNDIVVMIEKCEHMEQGKKIMAYLIRAYVGVVIRINNHAYPPMIQKILAYINTDLKEDLSLKSFAAHLNVNASYLSTLFSKEMGISLSEYVNQKRVDHAKKLLSGSEIPIKLVAEECGFQDTHYFCRVFKKYTGETPKVYRDVNSIKFHRKS